MTIYDDEAVALTAHETGVSIDDVRASVKISETYHQFHRSLKDKRKRDRQAEIDRLAHEQDMRNHPDWCWCEEKVDTEDDKCPRCGGEYRYLVGMA